MPARLQLLACVPLLSLVGCGSNPTTAPATATGPTRPNLPITINLPPGAATGGDAKPQAKARLKEIGLAFHEAHDQFMFFSAGLVAKSGVGLSWRVQLLPQLKQEDLYKQFKLDEPWDSEHNKKLVEKMPAVFASPGKAAPAGQTYLRSFVGPSAFLLSAAPMPVGPPGSPVKGRQMPREFTDGTSNTLIVAEAAEPVVWTKPDDLPFDGRPTNPKAALPKLGGPFADGFHGLMGDGAVYFFPKDVATDDLLRGAITVNGGEFIDLTPIRKANDEKK